MYIVIDIFYVTIVKFIFQLVIVQYQVLLKKKKLFIE